MRNRIKEIRLSRDLSLQQLADMVGTSNQQIHNLEAGKRKLSQDWMGRIANALHIPINDLLEKDSLPKVEVVGYITSNMKIQRDKIGEVGNLGEIDPPFTFAGIPVREIKSGYLKEDIQQPILIEGAVIYWHQINNIYDCLGKLCVILDMNDELIIKQLWQGSSHNTYTLTTFNAAPQMNIAIKEAYKIISIEPK